MNHSTAEGLLLFSLPWRVSGWPSTALGTLKAHLATEGIEATTLHLHMEVACALGIDRYHAVSDRAWDLGETLYACLLEPEERDRLLPPVIENLRSSEDEDLHRLADWAAATAVEDVGAATEACLERLDLSRYWLAGITVGALQLCSSIYMAHLLRRQAPHLHILLGGAGVVGEVGRNLLASEPAIDALVDGEGEEALLRIAHLGPTLPEKKLATVPNLWYRTATGELRRTETRVLPDLDLTPVPDYSEYYSTAEVIGYPSSAMVLPVEASRGCAWEHRCGPAELRGCTFCGLFRTSPDYREKSLGRLLAEIDELVLQSQKLDLAFVDAYLPDSYRHELLAALGDGSWDPTLWCELRCNLDDEVAALLARAGTKKVQLGVESFHTPTLKRMEKGTRAIDNIYTLRLCEEHQIRYQYNLITHYPGVPRQEVEDALENLPLLFGFRPPGVTDFYLDRGSRVYRNPQLYGLSPEDLDQVSPAYLPSRLRGRKITQVVPFRPEALPEGAAGAWEQLIGLVERWQACYRLATSNGYRMPLSYREGRDFVEVVDCRFEELRTLTIEGDPREIFLACDRPISRQRLEERLPHIPADRIEAMLVALARQGLVFREGHLNLAIAPRATLPSGSPRKESVFPRRLATLPLVSSHSSLPS